MHNWIIELCGWLPGIVFPTASILQLVKLIQSKTSEGVSVITWFLFAFANIGTFVYIQKYTAPQTFGYLIAASAQFCIVFIALRKRKAV